MDIAAVAGLGLAMILVIAAIIIEANFDISTLFAYLPLSNAVAAAWLVVVGGTLAATMVTSPLSGTIGMAKAILKTLMPGSHESAGDLAALFVRLSEKARREGLLSLEEEEGAIHNEFMKKGM